MSDQYDGPAMAQKMIRLESALAAANKEIERLSGKTGYCLECERLAKENIRYREALESLCYSLAGTEGTKTNAELPEWFRLRLKDAEAALHEKGGKAE